MKNRYSFVYIETSVFFFTANFHFQPFVAGMLMNEFKLLPTNNKPLTLLVSEKKPNKITLLAYCQFVEISIICIVLDTVWLFARFSVSIVGVCLFCILISYLYNNFQFIFDLLCTFCQCYSFTIVVLRQWYIILSNICASIIRYARIVS